MSNPREVRRTLERLFEGQRDDARLRDNLEGLGRDESLPGLTWYWGPILYRRNRVMFRSFILGHFSEWERGTLQWKRVPWKDHAAELEAWLTSARTHRDVALVRQLQRWKFADAKWGIDSKKWTSALLEGYRSAGKPAARAIVLDEFDDWFQLDEDAALALDALDRACGPFLLKHLPHGFFTENKRKLWKRLFEAANKAGDEKLQFDLYRKQISLKEWTAEVLKLADAIREPSRLCDELTKRHPEGWGLNVGDTMVKLLERRGRDVMPYVRQKLPELFRIWGRTSTPFVAIAKKRQWWDLWAAAIRSDTNNEPFNAAVAELLNDGQVGEADRLSRLEALAGTSREWNWPGLGLAIVHGLKDDIAVRLYERYPRLVHGPFKAHVTPTWWQGGPKLLQAAQQADDVELVDLLASRYATRAKYEYAMYGAKEQDAVITAAEKLGDYYQAIRDRDAAEFARRASNVLTRIPAYAIGAYGYNQLLRTNKLARLLFVRSFDAFLAAPESVRDLVEGSDIHVQMLGYRVLALDDDRARRLAVESLSILLGTLLRPLHRKTRLAAFPALANAARADLDCARLVLRRAREALRLPDLKYPKEELIGLIGSILHHQPTLRTARETPRIFGLAEVAP